MDAFERVARGLDNLYETMGASHPKLSRGRVWCRQCGATQAVDAASSLRHGWPKCCGYTMTIDSPEEQSPPQDPRP